MTSEINSMQLSSLLKNSDRQISELHLMKSCAIRALETILLSFFVLVLFLT